MNFKSIDMFCHVVDNFGDAGVVYRFAKEFLLAHPLCRIRVFCDDLSPLANMRPGIDSSAAYQQVGGIAYVRSTALDDILISQLGPADVVIEAFGCDIPDPYARGPLLLARVWINLEYLSAEPWVPSYHLQRSVNGTTGPQKYFFMPGFTKDTGGVIVDTAVESARPEMAARRLEYLNEFLAPFGLSEPNLCDALFGTVFTYMRGFDSLLRDLGAAASRAYLFVCGDKSKQGMDATLQRAHAVRHGDYRYLAGNVTVLYLPFIPQSRFDSLLCLSDFSLVRGEDSLVRAMLACRPFIWTAYIQDRRYHLVKVNALCNAMARYFDDEAVFKTYKELMVAMNDVGEENDNQTTNEDFGSYFRDLKKIEHAAGEMSYFMTLNCDLVKKISEFLSNIS
jgi:uncharacterized repeat protein (TIGR03837 family)